MMSASRITGRAWSGFSGSAVKSGARPSWAMRRWMTITTIPYELKAKGYGPEPSCGGSVSGITRPVKPRASSGSFLERASGRLKESAASGPEKRWPSPGSAPPKRADLAAVSHHLPADFAALRADMTRASNYCARWRCRYRAYGVRSFCARTAHRHPAGRYCSQRFKSTRSSAEALHQRNALHGQTR